MYFKKYTDNLENIQVRGRWGNSALRSKACFAILAKLRMAKKFYCLTASTNKKTNWQEKWEIQLF